MATNAERVAAWRQRQRAAGLPADSRERRVAELEAEVAELKATVRAFEAGAGPKSVPAPALAPAPAPLVTPVPRKEPESIVITVRPHGGNAFGGQWAALDSNGGQSFFYAKDATAARRVVEDVAVTKFPDRLVQVVLSPEPYKAHRSVLLAPLEIEQAAATKLPKPPWRRKKPAKPRRAKEPSLSEGMGGPEPMPADRG